MSPPRGSSSSPSSGSTPFGGAERSTPGAKPASLKFVEDSIIIGNRLFDICGDNNNNDNDEVVPVNANADIEEEEVITGGEKSADKGKQLKDGKTLRKGMAGKRPSAMQNKRQHECDDDNNNNDDDIVYDNDESSPEVHVVGRKRTTTAVDRDDPVPFKTEREAAAKRASSTATADKNGKKKMKKKGGRAVKLAYSKLPVSYSIVRNLDRIICSVKGQRKQNKMTRMKGGEYGFISLGKVVEGAGGGDSLGWVVPKWGGVRCWKEWGQGRSVGALGGSEWSEACYGYWA